ncbi:MAG: anti-sigma factor [Actinomycetota bacterium]
MSDRFPTDPIDDDPFLDPELAPLAALLGDAALWEEPPPELEEAVVAAVQHEAGTTRRSIESPAPVEPALAPVVPIERARRRWVAPLVSAAAAALLVVAGFGLASRLSDDAPVIDHEVALAGTELATGASARAEVTATPLGTRIILDVTGLPPAPEGSYYEAWLRQSPEIGVSAGTFHLRGGDGEIELWAGVTVDNYPLITVTLQEEGGGAASSGRVVLAGRVDG